MKVWINKKHFEIFQEMQDEGRSDIIEINTFRQFKDNREIEIELVTNSSKNGNKLKRGDKTMKKEKKINIEKCVVCGNDYSLLTFGSTINRCEKCQMNLEHLKEE